MELLLSNLQKNYIYRILKGEFRFDTNIRGYLNGTDIPFSTALYAVTDEVFRPNTQQLIYTSEVTNKVESYGEEIDSLIFIQNRFNELSKTGIWVNNEIVCPDDYDQIVFLWLNDTDGSNSPTASLAQSSTFERFRYFANQFRHAENEKFIYEIVEIDKQQFVCLNLKEACEFALKLNHTENWAIELHQKCCNRTYVNWQGHLKNADFKLLSQSKIYKNQAFIDNLKGKVSLFDENFEPMEFPQIHAMLLAEKG